MRPSGGSCPAGVLNRAFAIEDQYGTIFNMLRIAPLARARLENLVVHGYPNETCGLLLGRLGGETRVEHTVPGRNLNTARARDRYQLDPQDFLAADQDARRLGLEIVGVWHAHPDHSAHPSQTDREGAWAGWSYVIAAVTEQGVAEIRSWRLEGDRFIEEEIKS